MVGRRRHPATALVAELLACGLSERQVVSAAWHLAGHDICRRTVGRIRDGVVQRSESLVWPGEQLLDQPVTCARGHRVRIWPCRQCATQNQQAEQAAARRMTKGARPSAGDG